MQYTLTFTVDKKKYISKPFDFEALCRVNDECVKDNATILRCGYKAVEYMFEGTEATEDILKRLPPSKAVNLSKKAWIFYTEAMEEASKNE